MYWQKIFYLDTPEGVDVTCVNCETKSTPLWRRGLSGEYLCNACGLYFKIHSSHRPLALKSDVIKHRNRPKKMNAESTIKKVYFYFYLLLFLFLIF